MKIYDFKDYKDFIRAYIDQLQGRGEYGRLAKAANISSTLISQVFNGERELTLEQSFLISEYLNLSSEERDYFELLVLMRRAGIKKQQDHYLKKISALNEKHKSFKAIIKPKSLELSPSEEITYYTEWLHSAVRLLSEVEAYQSVEKLAVKLKVELSQVKESAEFLSGIGLVDYKNGKVKGLKNNLHLEKTSPLTYLRQLTWRMKALENFQRKNKDDYTFNALVTLEERQIEKIKDILKEGVAKAGDQVGKTKKPEDMMCLNIDFFRV